jgi:hypothetical protein
MCLAANAVAMRQTKRVPEARHLESMDGVVGLPPQIDWLRQRSPGNSIRAKGGFHFRALKNSP